MDGFPITPAAVPNRFFFRPAEMISKGSKAVAQTVQTNFRETVCGADTINLPPHTVAERAYIPVVIFENF